jgi:hypothetical protein
MSQIKSHFEMIVQYLEDADIRCDVTLPDQPDNQLKPVQECVEAYLQTFITGLAAEFIPLGKNEEMCTAAGTFRKCIYLIKNLPVRGIADKMVHIASKLHQDLCKDVKENGELLDI